MIARLRRLVRRRYVLWIGTRLPPCEQITRIISAAADRPLTWRERIEKRLHLVFCDLCSRFERQLALMRRLVAEARPLDDDADTAGGPGLSPEGRARLKRRLAQADADDSPAGI